MSRVNVGQKYMNEPRHSVDITGPFKVVRSKAESVDFTKASSLTSWLFLKYDMTYHTYRNKSKARREALRVEYMADTGNETIGPRRDEGLEEWLKTGFPEEP